MSKEYEELVKKGVNELMRKLPSTSPRKEEIKIVYGKVSSKFFEPEKKAWVAGFYQGDGFAGYLGTDRRYYPYVGIAQHKVGILALEEVGKLWYAHPSKLTETMMNIRKFGKVVIMVILPTLLPYLYPPKKEKAEFIVEHGSPVTVDVKDEFLRSFPSKSGKFVIKGSQEVWFDAVMSVANELYELPSIIHLSEEEAKEIEHVKKE